MWSNRRNLRRLDHRRRCALRLILEGLEPRTAPTANVFNNIADESALRAALAAADSNGFADNTIELSGSITLSDAASGPLVIQNATSTAKTLTIEGPGTTSASAVISGSPALDSRIFEVVAAGTAGVTVVLKDLT